MRSFLSQLPTVLTLLVLGTVAWWGYAWDWKAPSLPVALQLLGLADKQNPEENANAESNEAEKAVRSDQTLHLVKLASEEEATAAGIQTEKVVRGGVEERVTANGEVDFDQNLYAHLSTRAGGTAWRVYKHAGDEVKKNDVLALIACPDLARIKFDFQQTMLLVETRQRLLQRMKSAESSTPLQQIDSAEASLREARIRLFGDQQSLQNLGLTIRPADLAKLTDEQSTVRLRTLGIPDSLLQGLDVDKLTNNLLPMYAPFDGMVIKRDIVIGEMVDPKTPQFVLADLRRLWIMLHVRLEDANKVAFGQKVTFHLDGPGEIAPIAKIAWVSSELDEKTRTVTVRADVVNPDGRLRPHTFGTAHIVVDRAMRSIVSNEALQFDGQSHLVFVRGESPTEFQPVRVTLGPRHEKFTEIVSGVEAGQTIATLGSHVLLSELLKERIGGED